jgi:undecaprenyl-diphosphatase
VLIAISVAASRALLGVHWLTDVVAGLAIGAGWFTLVAIIFGGRAQRLGDPVSDQPQGAASGSGASTAADDASDRRSRPLVGGRTHEQ